MQEQVPLQPPAVTPRCLRSHITICLGLVPSTPRTTALRPSPTAAPQPLCQAQDLTDDGHALADVVEVQDGQQLVGDGSTQLVHCDGLGRAGPKHEAEIPGSRDQRSLVRGLSLVIQLPWGQDGGSEPAPRAAQGQAPPSAPTFALLLGHDGVAEREQAEELVHVVVSQLDGFQQAGVPELEAWVRQRVEGEVDWLRPLAGAEMGLPPCDTQHSQAPARRHPYLSQLRFVTQHVLHVTCKPGHGVNQDRDPTLLPHRHPRPGAAPQHYD